MRAPNRYTHTLSAPDLPSFRSSSTSSSLPEPVPDTLRSPHPTPAAVLKTAATCARKSTDVSLAATVTSSDSHGEEVQLARCRQTAHEIKSGVRPRR